MKCVFIKSDKDLILLLFFFLFKKENCSEAARRANDGDAEEAGMEEGCGRPFWSALLCFDTTMQRRITLAHLNARFMACHPANTHLSDLLIHTSL